MQVQAEEKDGKFWITNPESGRTYQFGDQNGQVIAAKLFNAAILLGYQPECFGSGVLKGKPNTIYFSIHPFEKGCWVNEAGGEVSDQPQKAVEPKELGYVPYLYMGGNVPNLRWADETPDWVKDAVSSGKVAETLPKWTTQVWANPVTRECTFNSLLVVPDESPDWVHYPEGGFFTHIFVEDGVLYTQSVTIGIRDEAKVVRVRDPKSRLTHQKFTSVSLFGTPLSSSFVSGTTDGGVFANANGWD